MSEGGGAILGPAITLAKDLGILEKIALLITPQYRVAAEKLAEVMRELEKNYQAIEDELQQLANLSFQFTDSSVERTKKLENLRPGAVRIRMEDAKGSCHKIANIYDTYLAAKLRELLIEEPDRIRIKNLFNEMVQADGRMMATVDSIAAIFEEQINKLEPLIKQNDLHEANVLIQKRNQEIQQNRHQIEAALVRIQALRAKYIEVSGAA